MLIILKITIRILILIFVQSICFQHNAVAQDSLLVIKQDTLFSGKPVKHRFAPDPLKATMLAVALPGLGQIYNRKYWKVPVAYGGFAAMFYFIGFNTKEYNTYVKAYQDFTDSNPHTNSFLEIKGFQDIDPTTYDQSKDPSGHKYYQDQLIRIIDEYKSNRDLSYIGLGFWYIATIIDANVDASLFNYDVSNNLDIAVMPVRTQLPFGFTGAGINVSLMFNF